MKIYLAHSLTQASEEFKKEMLSLRALLEEKHEVLEFLGLEKGTAQDVYNHDIGCVKKCDLVIAEVSNPSIGLGIEISTALHLGKKILAIANPEASVTRMVLGIDNPNFKFFRYNSIKEVISQL